MWNLQIIIVLVTTTSLVTLTTAESQDETLKTVTMEKADEKQMHELVDSVKGDIDLAKLVASLSVTMTEMEMENYKRDEKDHERDEEMKKKDHERDEENTKMKNEISKMKKMELENQKEIKNLHIQMKKKENKIRQLDSKTAGPVAPLAKFLVESAATIKNHTKRIVKLEKGLYNLTFGGKGGIPYGAKFIHLKPYLDSTYSIYTDILIWATAQAACANHEGQLASMETDHEWQHVFSQLNLKDSGNHHWLGASKAGPIVAGVANQEGFKWLTGGKVSKYNPAWWDNSSGGGKCLLAYNTGYFSATVDNDWLDQPCSGGNAFRSLCEFKKK